MYKFIFLMSELFIYSDCGWLLLDYVEDVYDCLSKCDHLITIRCVTKQRPKELIRTSVCDLGDILKAEC